MKKRYLGFIPAIIVITWAHFELIKWELSGLPFYELNPVAFAFVFVFWIIASVIGIFIALDDK